MFWYSVLAGLKVLTYWETYVAGLEYLAVYLIPMAVFLFFAKMKNAEEEGAGIGCFSIVLISILETVATTVFILTLAPIVLGLAEDAAWSLPWTLLIMAPSKFFELVGIMLVVSIALVFVPILGQIHSLHTLIRGGIVLIFFLDIIVDSISPGIVERVELVPDIWFLIGLLLISAAMLWVGMIVAIAITARLETIKEGIGPSLR